MRHAAPGPAFVALLLLALAAPAAAADSPPLHHDVSVRLDPATHRVDVTDALTLRAAEREAPWIEFRLHDGLAVRSPDGALAVTRRSGDDTGGDPEEPGQTLRLATWHVAPVAGTWPADGVVRLAYAGAIEHPPTEESEEYARSFARTPGTVGPEGAVLSGGTWWLPRLGDELVTFTLTADLPAAWDAVSQGRRTRHETAGEGDAARRIVTWECTHPMDEAYLIAAPFTEYTRAAGGVTAQAFLRTPDENLAARYLEATAQYVEMYRRLIGPYPFEKFALVENFWETGYGMPSFTLLGPTVIRLPFILHSSYPHEILHNWWGNSVYVDWERGNWCEGLTAYLADHLIREGQGRGTEYRRDALKGWRDYASSGRDFPLTAFRSRHSSATQAVGYGKCLMLWHMLRVRLGDERFAAGLQRLYAQGRFRVVAWDEIARVFSEVAGEDLAPFFREWTERTGALRLDVTVALGDDGGALTLRQSQEGEAYAGVVVPVALTFAGQADAVLLRVTLTGRETVATFGVARDRELVRIDVDPECDVFRVLDASETPPTLSELFGAEHVTLVVPPEGAPLAAEWRTFAAAWARGASDVDVVAEDALDALPAERAVWALGAANRFGPQVVRSLATHGARVDDAEARFGAEAVARTGHAFVFVARHPQNPGLAAGWVGCDLADALPGLARKLPHYGKYSYLAFEGAAPDNVVKGTWPATDSPLVRFVRSGSDTRPGCGHLPSREPLARLAPVFDAERMLADVRFLADDAQEGRGVGTAGLERSAERIAQAFAAAGLRPGGRDGSWFDAWTEEGGPDGAAVTLRNVVGVLPGSEPAWKDQSVVLGAHYDHLGRGWPDVRAGNAGEIHNGADDNASGVAVLLETARVLGPELKPRRSIVFVAFTGEEWGLKGSRHYVAGGAPLPARSARAMICLDTVGRLRGQKLTVLGAGTAPEWRHIAMGVGFTTGVESVCVADDPGGSDQVAFHEIGVPAVQLFTGPHADYHRPTDDVAEIDGDGLVKVATWLREAAVYLSEREEPLGAAAQTGGGAPRGEGRRVSLGTVPDFAFEGPGVRVASVLPDSPAARAGLREGDVLLALGGEELADLRAYGAALRARSPGDRVTLRVLRDGATLELDAELVAR